MGEYVNVSHIFGEDVFSDKVMQERLPRKVYKALKETIEENGGDIESDLGILLRFFERMRKRPSYLASVFSFFVFLRIRIRFKFTTKIDTPA
jgi:hypothetical protein